MVSIVIAGWTWIQALVNFQQKVKFLPKKYYRRDLQAIILFCRILKQADYW